jgi:hypothetical protein
LVRGRSEFNLKKILYRLYFNPDSGAEVRRLLGYFPFASSSKLENGNVVMCLAFFSGSFEHRGEWRQRDQRDRDPH